MANQDEQDNEQAKKIMERMQTASLKLNKTAPAVGHAKQIREFASERRKNLLAQYFDADLPATKAEMLARKHPEYLQKLELLVGQSDDAEIVIAKDSATRHSFEAARSLLSFNRESLRQLEG